MPEKIHINHPPENIEEELEERQRKDHEIAKAMARGANFDEIMKIENSPKPPKSEPKIIEFPDQQNKEKESKPAA